MSDFSHILQSSPIQSSSVPPTSTSSQRTPAGQILIANNMASSSPSAHETRIRLSEDEQLLFVKLCIEYGDNYIVAKSMEKFFLDMKPIVLEKLSVDISPRQVMDRLITGHKMLVANQKKLSGVAIEETDLMQAVETWVSKYVEKLSTLLFKSVFVVHLLISL